MVRQFQNITDSHDWIIQKTDRKLDTILVIDPYRRDPNLVTAQYLVIQRLDLEQSLDMRCRFQCLDSLLVPFHDVGLEPMLLVTGLTVVVQLFQICLVECYYHAAKIHIILNNSQNCGFF